MHTNTHTYTFQKTNIYIYICKLNIFFYLHAHKLASNTHKHFRPMRFFETHCIVLCHFSFSWQLGHCPCGPAHMHELHQTRRRLLSNLLALNCFWAPMSPQPNFVATFLAPFELGFPMPRPPPMCLETRHKNKGSHGTEILETKTKICCTKRNVAHKPEKKIFHINRFCKMKLFYLHYVNFLLAIELCI